MSIKYNTDPSFVGTHELIEAHTTQIMKFEEWASRDDWEMFHESHYDWWVFPVNRRSSFGLRWTVYEEEIAELKKDQGFLNNYIRGAQLVSASWGWDLFKKGHISDPKPSQSWHNWPVRLYKAAQSVQLFGYNDLFGSLKGYALILMREGEAFTYGGKDLGWLFTTGKDPKAVLPFEAD